MAEKTETPTLVQVAQKVHRPRHLIESDLTAARARFAEMHRADGAYQEARARALTDFDFYKAKWDKENPNRPFRPEMFNPPLAVPDRETDQTRAFHAQHYRVDNLEKELIAAKAAETGAY